MNKHELALLLDIPSYNEDELYWNMIDTNDLLKVINDLEFNSSNINNQILIIIRDFVEVMHDSLKNAPIDFMMGSDVSDMELAYKEANEYYESWFTQWSTAHKSINLIIDNLLNTEHNITNTHQSNTNLGYYICEKCECSIFEINHSNYCPDCGCKIKNKYCLHQKEWKNIKNC